MKREKIFQKKGGVLVPFAWTDLDQASTISQSFVEVQSDSVQHAKSLHHESQTHFFVGMNATRQV